MINESNFSDNPAREIWHARVYTSVAWLCTSTDAAPQSNKLGAFNFFFPNHFSNPPRPLFAQNYENLDGTNERSEFMNSNFVCFIECGRKILWDQNISTLLTVRVPVRAEKFFNYDQSLLNLIYKTAKFSPQSFVLFTFVLITAVAPE